MSPAVALSLKGISKCFGGLQANAGISLHLLQGEILALLGENGAGKTTLMSILFGSYVADAGEIEVFGEPLKQGSTKEALALGIGMVQQHFSLADNLSVFDNIIIGTESLLGWLRRSAAARAKITRLAEQCGFALHLDASVSDLSVGERQKVEIIKALFRNARILILDEPTAVLTPPEANALFATLRRLVADGLSVILISHKLREILDVSHRICVLRHGKMVHECPTSEAQVDELATAMVGRDIKRKTKTTMALGKSLLRLHQVRLHQGSATTIDLELHEREILGITGVAGNGQQELCDMFTGLAPPVAGTIEWLGQNHIPAAAAMTMLGVARIPADRSHVGVFGDMSVTENLVSNRYGEYCRWGFFHQAAIAADAATMLEQFDVRCDTPHMEARLLSGGNMQKLILARELARPPRLIIANQPTRGLDVGAISEIHRQLLEACERGAGMVLITEDLDELFALADKVAVMYKGTLGTFFPTADINVTRVGLLMGGSN